MSEDKAAYNASMGSAQARSWPGLTRQQLFVLEEAIERVRTNGGRGALRVELRKGQVYKVKGSYVVTQQAEDEDQPYGVGDSLLMTPETFLSLAQLVADIRAAGGMGELTLTIEQGQVRTVCGEAWFQLCLERGSGGGY